MSQEDDRRAFLKAIADNPWDAEGPRLVYADWLDEVGEYDEAERQRQHVQAERWLREFAGRHGGNFGEDDEDGYVSTTYEQVVQAGRDFADTGDYYTQYGSDSLRNAMYKTSTAAEYWRCWSVVTGLPVPGECEEVPPSPFSCSC
jgi:uncharacterized protein (TIGR02996 family)